MAGASGPEIGRGFARATDAGPRMNGGVRGYGPGMRRQHSTASTLAAISAPLLVVLLLLPGTALAHEQWVLTPEQMQEWTAKPFPELFSRPSLGNLIPILAFLAFLACWVRLGFTGARELFSFLEARLGAYGGIVGPFLRFSLALFLMAWALCS